ncbi:MAG TPA: c-type cytochrome [Methylomirabilota bacterium]|jgi:mono/diheme cytochrome c family protein
MNGRLYRIITGCGLAVLMLLLPTVARPQAPGALPAEWTMVPGWSVFVDKGCGTCHRVRGVGDGTAGPDLAGLRGSRGLFEMGAAMWNHLPRIAAAMRDAGTQPPRLTPLEFSSLAAFLFTTQYHEVSGNPAAGSRLFTSKSCAQCHAVGGRGGSVGPALDGLKRSSSPVLMAAAMWNHGAQMAEAMNARGIARPTFRGTELADLVAHIAVAARDQGGQPPPVVPGTPERGEKLFADKGCVSCHAVGAGKSPTAAPRLATQAHRVSAGEFAGLMWNHGARMWAAMRQGGLPVPRLTGQEMADIAAYLYTAHYFDSAAGRAGRGRELVQRKGCLDCHAIYRKGGNSASDLAIDNVVGTPAGQVAAMWNHARYMATQARQRSMTLPALTGQELADISTYLAALGSGPPKQK